MGRAYMKGLRRELVRLAGCADHELDLTVFAGVAEKLDEKELLTLTKVYQHRIDRRFPQASQLNVGGKTPNAGEEDGVCLI